MSRSVLHETFTIDRRFEAKPARVFAAWAKPEAKARWFSCHGDWVTTEYTLDFRAGGHERLRIGPPGGTVHAFDGHYHDIVANQRIVYAYEMRLDERLISISLVTVLFEPAARGTRLVFTEQGAFLDGYDDVSGRVHGTNAGLDKLEAELGRPAAAE
jgi:uncharacterized protein YndB with AHSA1/START domain